jgi:hypothetical protein
MRSSASKRDGVSEVRFHRETSDYCHGLLDTTMVFITSRRPMKSVPISALNPDT